MVTCRCGCEFDNSRWDAFVCCPQCKRIYANAAPDMFHPRSEEEKRWKCSQCGAMNDPSHAGAPRRVCAICGAGRPGDPRDWY